MRGKKTKGWDVSGSELSRYQVFASMPSRDTHQAIAGLTDMGVFEDLALSVMRVAEPLVTAVVQTGVNPEGRTHRSPVDGIGFVPGAKPEHLVAVHHTITSARKLRTKWLSNSSDKPGDLPKTVEIVRRERERTPDLAATLFLTTSLEPSEDLVRDARAAGSSEDISVDFWPLSRLAHVLDTTADGQAIRRRIFGVPQDRLSADLFADIGARTLDSSRPTDDPAAWIDRTAVISPLRPGLTFLVGESGSGKTVACRQALEEHLRHGGLGLVLDAPAISAAVSLEDAIDIVLKRFEPTLANGRSALEFGAETAPLLIVVDDINGGGNGPALAMQLVNWAKLPAGASDPRYRVLCPLWPQALLGLDEKARTIIDDRSVELPPMSMAEATDAMLRRAAAAGKAMTHLQASEIAEALGRDPLLMAFHESGDESDPERIIANFVERSLQRLARLAPAPSLRAALDHLAKSLLTHRDLSPDWRRIASWETVKSHTAALQTLLEDRTVVGLHGPSTDARLTFRHDRVREHILIRAALSLQAEGQLTDDLLGDPAFAEVIGGALVDASAPADLLKRCGRLAPLALADAFSRTSGRVDLQSLDIVAELERWLKAAPKPRLPALQWSMTEKLARADGPDVIRLAEALGPLDIGSAMARLRNGDLKAGIYLCARVDPARRAVWAQRCIAHAQERYGDALREGLALALTDDASTKQAHSGALRLAGHLGEPALLAPILKAWSKGLHRDETLGDYIWAASRCVADDLSVLNGFYDAWGALSDTSEKEHYGSPRYNLGEFTLKWAFASQPPARAMAYLIRALDREDLGRPILSILEYVDHPDALCAVAESWAARQRDREPEKMSFGAIWRHMRWGHREEHQESMSRLSRDALERVWRDPESDDALALASFALWEATAYPEDLRTLSTAPDRDILRDALLRARLERGDASAIPEQIERIRSTPHPDHWWQYGRFVWSPALTALLDETLSDGTLRHDKEGNPWLDAEWIHSELLMRIDVAIAEPILIRHWDHIQQGSHFVQAALFHATPKTIALAAQALATAPDPKRVLRFTMMHFNQLTGGRNGFHRQAQVLALEPYFPIMEPSEIEDVAEACNAAGWFDLRQRVVDPTGHSGRGLLTPDALLAKLERLSSDERRPFIGHEVRDILRTGWTWSELFEAAFDWASDRADERSVALLIDMVCEAGDRRNIEALQPFDGRWNSLDASIANAAFIVGRRTLN
nr:ATP-binding protein [Brevundimonas naejangsanensis]